MMPVVDIMKRRAKIGRRKSCLVDQIQSLYFDVNNNAKKRNLPLLRACFPCKQASPSSSFDDFEESPRKDPCEQETSSPNRFKIGNTKKRDTAYHVTAGVYIDIVEGRFVVTNMSDMLFQVDGEGDRFIGKKMDFTPPFYDSSNIYYNDIARSRQQVLDAMGRIGYMIETGQLEGVPADKAGNSGRTCSSGLTRVWMKVKTSTSSCCTDLYSYFSDKPDTDNTDK
ncbi:uncharacterized protein LOC121379334 [Gigantopelta aegis]|uniref:uncharacterized protein LOC121379334 n=1 Tax=Gigantopelta aegis TaxID=1735272 RepID=UPI001B88CD70|nr:uncharacterized protein LOC121379334 [Gigantopelta aegis]XP_041363841.1 uncharacterized protein LOC121379334 [Gigantopelta aegis]